MGESSQSPVTGSAQSWTQEDLVGFGRHRADLQRARSALVEAELADRPSERFLAAQLAALRVAALVLALRSRPAGRSDPADRGSLKKLSAAGGPGSGRAPQPRNAWQLLAEVAPEYGEWAAFFAASQGKREAVRAGAATIVTTREADDLVRDAGQFLTMVERRLDQQWRHQGHPSKGQSGQEHASQGHPSQEHASQGKQRHG